MSWKIAKIPLAAFSSYFPGSWVDKCPYNLAYYLGLIQFVLRPQQDQHKHWGLSSPGRNEAHVMSTLDSVIDLLCQIDQITPEDPLYEKNQCWSLWGCSHQPAYSDPTMEAWANCIMLEKEYDNPQASQTLNDFRDRVQVHQHKRRSRIRALHWRCDIDKINM